MDDHENWKRCGRCKQAFYCDKDCQVAHWKRGGHKQACKAPPPCTICLDDDPLPIQCGCGCRGAAGSAHVACKAAYAAHQGPGYHKGWYTCPTCNQDYTGAMELGLAEALCARLQGRADDNHHRLCAQTNVANAYLQVGRLGECEALYRAVLATRRRVDGPNHKATLLVAGNLGIALLNQDKHSAADAMLRDTLKRQRVVLGAEHESTLLTARNLSTALQNQGKHAEAEPVLRDSLPILQRVLGEGHRSTLQTANSLAALLLNKRQHAEAEELSCGALAWANRTLGPEHPSSLSLSKTLGTALGRQGLVTQAAALLTATLTTQLRVMGSLHPETLRTVHELRKVTETIQELVSKYGMAP